MDFIKPDYSRNHFTHIPALVAALLGAGEFPPVDLPLPKERYGHVVVMLADAFGWRFFQRYRPDYATLRDALALRMTSQFPSTTAAHVTCWHSGLPVGEHGVYEWQYYEPQVDDIITPLLFSFSGMQQQRDALKPHGVSPQQIYPAVSFYQQLQAAGVSCHVLQHKAYTPSTYSDLLFRGAQVHPFGTLAEALTILKHLLTTTPPRTYIAFYFDQFDHIGHHYGPDSPQLDAEADLMITALERLLLAQHFPDTLFLMTADHGQVEVSPEGTTYLNRLPALADLPKLLRRNRRGELLIPAGSPRDLFLYVQPEHLDEAAELLTEALQGRAEVRRSETLLAEGYFGPRISQTFLGRLGDLVILPAAGEAVWWYEAGHLEQSFYGHHGGLTAAEMEIPLLAWEL